MPKLIALDLMAPAELTVDGAVPSALYAGFRNFELARMDASIATMYNAQSGLFRTAVCQGGSPQQAADLDPRVRSFELTGVFALTEPDHGSDIAGGLATTARRDGDSWILDGAKRWIGGAMTADVLAIFARDQADGQVKAFLVPRESEGVRLREDRRQDLAAHHAERRHLPGRECGCPIRPGWLAINSFEDVAGLLRSMRSDVAWIATGVQAGAYEAAVRYTTERIAVRPTDRPASSSSRKNSPACWPTSPRRWAWSSRLTQQQEQGVFRDEDSALAKMFTSSVMRETVALAREVVGGNGITLQTDVARFHADAEAVYSYEGTHEINALIVGRSITGLSAFTR